MKVHAIYIFIALLAGLLLCGSLGGSVKEGVDSTLDNGDNGDNGDLETSFVSDGKNLGFQLNALTDTSVDGKQNISPPQDIAPSMSDLLKSQGSPDTNYTPFDETDGTTKDLIGLNDVIDKEKQLEKERRDIPAPLPISSSKLNDITSNKLLNAEILAGPDGEKILDSVYPFQTQRCRHKHKTSTSTSTAGQAQAQQVQAQAQAQQVQAQAQQVQAQAQQVQEQAQQVQAQAQQVQQAQRCRHSSHKQILIKRLTAVS